MGMDRLGLGYLLSLGLKLHLWLGIRIHLNHQSLSRRCPRHVDPARTLSLITYNGSWHFWFFFRFLFYRFWFWFWFGFSLWFGRRCIGIIVVVSIIEEDVGYFCSWALIWIIEGDHMKMCFIVAGDFFIFFSSFYYFFVRTCHL